MNNQYFLIVTSVIFFFFLIVIGISRTTKIFLWNYFAWFSALITYLFIDTLCNFVDQYSNFFKIHNPDAFAGFLSNNKTNIVIIMYFLFFFLFYKSSLFEIQIQWLFRKIIWYAVLPVLTVIDLIFTLIVIINWPETFNYSNYENLIQSMNITNKNLLMFFQIIPWIIIFVPFLVLLLFLQINIHFRIWIPMLKKKPKEENNENEEKE